MRRFLESPSAVQIFSAGVRSNTRAFFLSELIKLRRYYPNDTSQRLFDRFAARLYAHGFYESRLQVSRAWRIAFSEPTDAHFDAMCQEPIHVLRNMMPEMTPINAESDIIRF